ncbi:glycoside hydrolase family 99-like domain-containing protein [Streptomyces scopuliridis]|uniref:glycoside hydrolase family 99-like domain-containing protein n=1 Tax=Streptomyces scopuliridis TaxID=452529 RepID=UPI0036AB7689
MTKETPKTNRPKVLAYYFPDWHKDVRNAAWFGPGWDEWKLLSEATPRFEGHRQPRIPLHGTFDEATPESAGQQIRLAKEYGVDGFLVDYYWYDDGPYLQRALDEGILKADNNIDIEFALMWANHELVDIFPHAHPDNAQATRLKDGALDRAAFEAMVYHIVGHYFSRPNYLTVDGRPWFTVYDVPNFVAGLGGIEEAADALAWFDSEVQRAGFPGVHLDAVLWSSEVLPTAEAQHTPASLVGQLGFRSATSYIWVHQADLATFDFPTSQIKPLREAAFREYERYASQLDIPFYPNVTVGWDPSPRTNQDQVFTEGRYPWTPIWDPTPQEFEDGLREAKSFLERHTPTNPIITINAWNEWTEGSVLLPDSHNGYRFLEAIRNVFGATPPAEDRPAVDAEKERKSNAG